MSRPSVRALSYGGAVVAVGLASLTTGWLWPLLEPSPSLFFFPMAIAVAVYGGLGPALLATVLSTTSITYFFLPPYFSLKVGHADFVGLALFAITALLITALASAWRRAEHAYRRLIQDLEQRVAERTAELAAAHSVLDTAQRLEAVGRLAGGIAHDFNNLLTVIIGNAELLDQDLPADGAARELLVDVQKAAARAASLTRQLLAYSRRQRLQLQIVSLNEVVRTALALLQRLLPDAVTLGVNLAPDLPTVCADPGQLEQVIMNLAINASDAMPAGGTVSLSTAPAYLAPADLRDHPDLMPGPYVRLTVGDTGTGMDAVTAAQVFEPFFTTKPVGKGTGLGLSTAYGIVKQSGGDIWLDTAPGRGSTFDIYLPVAAAASES